MVAIISEFMVFLFSTNFQEFTETPIMSSIFFIGFFLLVACLVSCLLVYRKSSRGRRVFNATASLAIVISWIVVVVLHIFYENNGTIVLLLFLTILFLPLYFQLYLLNFHESTRQLFATRPIESQVTLD